MNNFFSFPRFVSLFRKTVLERPLQLLGSMGLMLAGAFIIYAFFSRFIFIGAAQNISFLWGLFGGGSFVASLIFNYFSGNAMGSSYLTLPASSFEKWLCGIILVGIIYPLVFCSVFRGIDWVFVSIYRSHLDPKAADFKRTYDAYFPLRFDRHFVKDSFVFFYACAGAMLCGSLFFNKASFIKVAFIICAVCIGLFTIHFILARSLFPDVKDAFPYQGVQLTVGKDEANLNISDEVRSWLTAGLFVLLAALWALPLIRLKEKEF